ncbi:hypothetical protein CH63R_01119 [Colletotrichum higginsianum IMI 349063]|uniref:Uncharacterized protein n=1 Tax=Colletotrichum higginsianum (strain IMI 349063) TaxID=759273 RepID=A0A1B7YV74_COLHI|nr:hypothetical protein CH63R_01119 [Colletotrichum higginsianum IMI 349063]OBR15939.1 hypothetical protein CH63R_01119 [Colletotrichum higginsianum IMI 349063]
MEANRAADEARRRREDTERREEVNRLRDRDRGDRGRGRGGDAWRGRRGDRDYDHRGRPGPRFGENRSRSPAPRHRDTRDRGSFRESARDSYVPRNRVSSGRGPGRRRTVTRSPSSAPASARSASRSRSAERKRESSRGSPSPAHRRSRRDRDPPSPRPARNRSTSLKRSEGGYRDSRRKRGSTRSTPRLEAAPLTTRDDPAVDHQAQNLPEAPDIGVGVPDADLIMAVQSRILEAAPRAAMVTACLTLQASRGVIESRTKKSKERMAIGRTDKGML